MLIDRPNVREGSYIQNAVVPSGTADPTSPNDGELFFRTDLGTGGTLRVFRTAVGWVEVGATALASHEANAALHLTSAQNTLLDGLNATLTAAELNFVDGVTSNIQTQFGTQTTNLNNEIARATAAEANLQAQITANDGSFDTHVSDNTVHLTSAQNTLLDGLNATLTAAELNFVDGVTSNIQTQLNTGASNLTTHIADATLHLTASQNTLLDGISGVTFVDVNRLAGIDSYLTSVSSANIASYLATLTSTKVNKAGDTMTGNLVMSGATVTGVPNPTNASDVANKGYVDALAGGIDWKAAVRAATTGAITLSGLQTIDGVALATNDRVLVKDQATTSTNGIYLASSGAWSRAADYDTALEVSQSAVYVLINGTAGSNANGGGSFVQTATITTFPGDPIVFTPFSGPVINTAGNGISLGVGGQVAVKEAQGIAFDGGGNVIVDLYSGGGLMTTTNNTTSSTAANAQLALTNVGTAGTYRSVTTDSKGRVTAGTNPTTLAGYGITDAQPLDDDLTAIAALASTGFAVRTAADTWAQRSIAVSGNGLTITNGNGVSGNPTVTSNGVSTNTPSTLVFRDASGNFSAGIITATLTGNVTGNVTGSASLNVLKAGDTMTGTLTVGSNILTAGTPASLQAYFSTAPYGTSQGDNRTHFGYNNAGTYVNYIRGVDTTVSSNMNVVGNLTHAGNTVWDAGNDGAGSGMDADLLDGMQTWVSGNNWGQIPFSNNSGVMEIGRYLDFHSTDTGTEDYTARIASGPTSYSSFMVSGSTGGYQGFQFSDTLNDRTFMVRNSDGLHGVYAVGTSAWDWYFDPALGTIRMQGSYPVLHSNNYTSYAPSLTGSGASGTWNINITGNSATVGGFAPDTAATANTLALRTSSGHIFANHFNSTDSSTGSVGAVMVKNTSDNYIRSGTAAGVATYIANAFNNIGATPNGTTNDPYGAISVTQPSGATNYAYFGMTRQGQIGWSIGVDTSNRVFFGHSTSGFSSNVATRILTIDASGNLVASGNVTAFSDRRLKTDIEPVYNALNKVLKLNGVTYKRTDTNDYGVGLIAQDVQAVVPEAVKEEAETGLLSVAYGNLVGVLVEAIKDLNTQIQELKAQLAAKDE